MTFVERQKAEVMAKVEKMKGDLLDGNNTVVALARRYQLSVPTIQKYRKLARERWAHEIRGTPASLSGLDAKIAELEAEVGKLKRQRMTILSEEIEALKKRIDQDASAVLSRG